MAEPIVRPNRRGQYLVLYNVTSGFLWFAVLARTVLLLGLVGPEYVYAGVGDFTKWVQTLALLEIVHSATGMRIHSSKVAVPFGGHHKLSHIRSELSVLAIPLAILNFP